MKNKYKHVLTVINLAKNAISGHIETLLPDIEAVDAVLNDLTDYLQEMSAKNKDRKKEIEEQKLFRGGPNDR